MTNGKKIYDPEHNAVYKEFNDKDFTAIDILRTNGINVILLTGDGNINGGMANKRGLDIIVTKEWLKVQTFDFNKCEKLDIIKDMCSDLSTVGYVGDDYFDIPVLKAVEYAYCPADAPSYVQAVSFVLCTNGGEGVVAELVMEILDEAQYNGLWD